MKRINLKRSAALVLAAATIVGSLAVPSVKVQAANKTVYLVTEEQDNGGGKTKYTYNKKGLLTKEVYTDTYKSKSNETKTTNTTKYTYNKKNRISAVSYEGVYTNVSYYTDNYGDRRPRLKDGKASTTTTNKDKATVAYTYDKKGKVTQTVETSYGVEIPENTTDSNTTPHTYDIPARYQADANGAYIRTVSTSYRYKDADGDEVGKYLGFNYGEYAYDSNDKTSYYYYAVNTIIDNLYFSSDDDEKAFKDSIAKETKYGVVPGTGVEDVSVPLTTTTTTTYTDNGNGSVTKTVVSDSESFDSANSTATNIVKTKDSVTTVTTVTVKKEVTTSYTYDKKKRVKKAVADTVTTTTTTGKRTETDYVGAANQSSSEREFTTTETSSSRLTDTYTYNKKGKATKVVTLSEPDIKYEKVINRKYPDSEYQNGQYVTVTREASESITRENGSRTKITTKPTTNKDGSVTAVTTTKVVAYPANTYNYTTTFKYDKKGNFKSSKGKTVTTNNRAATYTIVDGVESQVYNKITDTIGGVDVQVDDHESPVYTTKVTTSTSTNSKDSELKKNTTRLTKAVASYKSLAEGESKSDYSVSRTTYKVKGKKVASSAASSANKQQWIIQNGFNNGEEGLRTRSFYVPTADADNVTTYYYYDYSDYYYDY